MSFDSIFIKMQQSKSTNPSTLNDCNKRYGRYPKSHSYPRVHVFVWKQYHSQSYHSQNHHPRNRIPSIHSLFSNHMTSFPQFLQQQINQLGQQSAKAQGLHQSITSYDQLLQSKPTERQVVFFIVQFHHHYCDNFPSPKKEAATHHQSSSNSHSHSNSSVTILGYLKVGVRSLYLHDPNKPKNPMVWIPNVPCVFDFYIQQQYQRNGFGKLLFDSMLFYYNHEDDTIISSKLSSFQTNSNSSSHSNRVVEDGNRTPPLETYTSHPNNEDDDCGCNDTPIRRSPTKPNNHPTNTNKERDHDCDCDVSCTIQPEWFSYDRPSDKMKRFLCQHYQFQSSCTLQYNNFAVYEGFWEGQKILSTYKYNE